MTREIEADAAATGLEAGPMAVDLCVQCLGKELAVLLHELPAEFKRAWRDRLGAQGA